MSKEGSEAPHLTESQVIDRAGRGVVAVTLRGLSVRAIGFAGTIVLARLLAPDDFGLIAFGLGITALGQVIASGGLGSALLRGPHTPDRAELDAMFGLQLTVTLLIVAMVAAIGIPLGDAGQLTAVMCLALPLDAVRAPNAILLTREMSYGPIVRAEIGEILLYNAFAITAVALGAGVWGVALATVARAAAGSGLLLYLGPLGLPRFRPSWRRSKGLLRFGFKFQAVSLVNIGRDFSINVVVAAVGGLAALGLWALAWRVLQVVFLVFEALWRVSFPAVARLLDIKADVRPVLERGLAMTSSVAALIVAPLAGSAPALIPLLFGGRWYETGQIVSAACVALLLNSPVSACTSGYLYAAGRAGYVLGAISFHSVLWIALTAPLVIWLGAPGVGIALMIMSAADVFVFSWPLKRDVGVPVFRICAIPCLAGIMGSAVGYAIATQLEPRPLGGALAAVAALVVCVTPLLIFRRDVLAGLLRLLRRYVRPAAAADPADA